MQMQYEALIITRSTQLRDSLQILLRALPQLVGIRWVGSDCSALRIARETQPTLVLLDYDSTPNELTMDLRQLRAVWPQARYLVLLDDEQDRQQVESAGADVILVKGIRAATILETIEVLLFDEPPVSPGERSQDGDL